MANSQSSAILLLLREAKHRGESSRRPIPRAASYLEVLRACHDLSVNQQARSDVMAFLGYHGPDDLPLASGTRKCGSCVGSGYQLSATGALGKMCPICRGAGRLPQ